MEGPRRRTADELLLVYNEQSPISKAVAADYAAKRGVKNVLAVRCTDSAVNADAETIARADYATAIEAPVRAYLAGHPDIQFILLTKGVPIRIRGAATGERPDHSPADRPLNASVDSTLAALGYADDPRAVKIQITGSGATGFGYANRYWNSKRPFSHAQFGG